MGKDRLEHIITNTIGEYESPINTDELWANLQGSIPGTEAPPTKGAAFLSWKWLSLSVVALLLIGGVTWYSVDKNGELQPVAAIESGNISVNDAIITTTEGVEIENNLDNDLEENVIDENSTIIESSTVNSSNSLESINTETKKSTNNTTTKIQLTNIASIQNSSSAERNALNDKIVTDNDSKNLAVTDENESLVIAKTTNENETTNSSLNIEENKASSILATTFETNKSIASVNTEFVENSVSFLTNQAEIGNAIGNPNKVTCPSFGNKRGGGVFIGELQLIPYYSSPIIKAQGILGEQWKSRKESTEQYLEAFQINLIGRYQMNSGLYFQAGVGYGQIDEKFSFNSSDIEVTTENDLPVIIILRPNGTSDTIVGSVEVTTESIFNAETYNYHRMIELPFAIGYEFNLNNKMGIYLDAGGAINLSTFRKGYHIVDDIDVITFDDATRPVFKTTTGFKLNGSVGLRYYTTGGVTFSIGPDIRYHMSNWIRDEHPIELRYLDLGLRVGIGYAF